MDAICIDRSLIGTEKHLVVDDGYTWIDEPPKDSWFLGMDPEHDHALSVNTLLRLHNHRIDVSPPERFVSAMSTVMSGSQGSIPWSFVMPQRDHRAFVDNLIKLTVEAIKTLPKDYYRDTWVSGTKVLASLRPASIDVGAWNDIVASRPGNLNVVETFKPDKRGIAQKIKYDRFGTRTGRLTVESGPNILTLKREFRKRLIRSSHVGGSIISIDFSALEARVLLYESGGRCDEQDMYTMIARDLFHGSASRQQIKGAVISEVYGSSKHVLGEALGIHGKELDAFVSKVKGFFKINDLKQRVKSQFVTEGWITNRYGRRVMIDDPLDHIFVNYYAQSTGADVAMQGFSDMISRMRKLPGVRPLYVLHDALIVDSPKEHVDAIMSENIAKVKGYVQKFYVKPEIMSCTP